MPSFISLMLTAAAVDPPPPTHPPPTYIDACRVCCSRQIGRSWFGYSALTDSVGRMSSHLAATVIPSDGRMQLADAAGSRPLS